MAIPSRVFEIVISDVRLTGGMERANYALAEYLLDRGDEVHLVAHSVDPAIASRPGAVVHPAALPLNSYLLGEPWLNGVGRKVARKLQGRGARVIANGGNCLWNDVNWVHLVHAAYRPEVRTGLLRRVKNAVARWTWLRTERRSIGAARLVIANSEQTRRDVVQRLGVPSERVHLVYLGTDPERFGPIGDEERRQSRERMGWPPERPVVAFVGALGDRRKGFDTLYDAWSRLRREPFWDARLVVMGAGAEQTVWKARAEAEGLGDRIEFLGYRKDVPQVLAGCDAMVHPARYEPYGLGVQEALCRGLPTFVTASAGVAERYPADLRDFLIDDPNDADELAGRLLRWWADIPRSRERVAALGETLRRHTWRAMAAEMVALIEGSA